MFNFKVLSAVAIATVVSGCAGGGSSSISVLPAATTVMDAAHFRFPQTCGLTENGPRIQRLQTRLYVSNFKFSWPGPRAKTVSVFDLTHDDAALQPIDVGESSNAPAIALDSRGNLYVAHTFEKTITIVDTLHGNTRLAPIISGLSGPTSLAISPDGKLYVADGYSRVSIFDTTDGNRRIGEIVDKDLTNPSVLTLDSCGKLYVAPGVNSNDSVRVYDTKHGNARLNGIDENPPAAPGYLQIAELMTGLTVDATGRLYIANGDGTIAVFDTLAGNLRLPTIGATGGADAGMAVDSRGRLYVAEFVFGSGNSIKIFDTTDHNRLIKTLTADGLVGPYAVAIW